MRQHSMMLSLINMFSRKNSTFLGLWGDEWWYYGNMFNAPTGTRFVSTVSWVVLELVQERLCPQLQHMLTEKELTQCRKLAYNIHDKTSCPSHKHTHTHIYIYIFPQFWPSKRPGTHPSSYSIICCKKTITIDDLRLWNSAGFPQKNGLMRQIQ